MFAFGIVSHFFYKRRSVAMLAQAFGSRQLGYARVDVIYSLASYSDIEHHHGRQHQAWCHS